MPYDADVVVRQGSIRALYAEAVAKEGANEGAGSAVIQPGAVFTLYQENGTIEPGFSAVAVSGYEHGPQRDLRVWYLLNTAGIEPGAYRGLFMFQANEADGIDQTFAVDLKITVLAPVEVTATYVEAQLATSPLYQTRLHAGDTDVSSAIWSDAELTYLLTISGGVAQLAAAQALETLALDRAKLANAVRIGAFGNGEAEAYKAIAERAKRLRTVAPVLPVVSSPDQVFVPSSDRGRCPGTMKDW
jgi:hypothetical protein